MIKSRKLKADLTQLLNYLWHDERKHYLERRNKNHIYLTIRRLAKEISYKP